MHASPTEGSLVMEEESINSLKFPKPPKDFEPTVEKPFLLSDADVQRVHRTVRQFLPSEYDHEFIADTIILNSWMRDVRVISNEYIRNKCISAWRQKNRERRRNEGAIRSGATKGSDTIMAHGGTKQARRLCEVGHDGKVVEEQDIADRKMLVEEAVGVLSPFERKLVWMRFYDGQTLDEIAARTTLNREQVQSALKVAIYKMRVHLKDV